MVFLNMCLIGRFNFPGTDRRPRYYCMNASKGTNPFKYNYFGQLQG